MGRIVMGRLLIMVTRQVVMAVAVMGQSLRVIEGCERADEDWKDGCHFPFGSLRVGRMSAISTLAAWVV